MQLENSPRSASYSFRLVKKMSAAFATLCFFLLVTIAYAQAQEVPANTSSCHNDGPKAIISVQFDEYPSETSWEIVELPLVEEHNSGDGGPPQTLVCQSPSYEQFMPNTSSRSECCLSMPNKRRSHYRFTALDSYGDGLCCQHGRGSYSVHLGISSKEYDWDDSLAYQVVDGASGTAATKFQYEYSSQFKVDWFQLEEYWSQYTSEAPTPTPTEQPTPYWESNEPTHEPWSTTRPTSHDIPYTNRLCSSNSPYDPEENGCINPFGCKFIATPRYDEGSFLEEACWMCCSFRNDECGVCTGCQCGYPVNIEDDGDGDSNGGGNHNGDDDAKEDGKWWFQLAIVFAMAVLGFALAFLCVCCMSKMLQATRRDKVAHNNHDHNAAGSTAMYQGGRRSDGGTCTGAQTGEGRHRSNNNRGLTSVPSLPIASAVPLHLQDQAHTSSAITAKVVLLPPPSAPPLQDSSDCENGVDPAVRRTSQLVEVLEESSPFARAEQLAKWLKENPDAAKNIFPADVGKAISSISFSLDQITVARDLAHGITKAGGSVLCDHCIEAVRNCSNSVRTEVALAMASYVSDLANEASVLNMFQSPQREQIDRAMNLRSRNNS